MRKSNAVMGVVCAGLLITAGARLPLEREIANYPELKDRFGYRLVSIVPVANDTTRVRLTHRQHRDLDQEGQLERARQVAEVVRHANDALRDDVLIVELGWTWRSDLTSRRSKVEHVIPTVAHR